jgi:hypothetical protein
MFVSPVQRLSDSKYSMLVSYSLISRARFDVEDYLQNSDSHVFHNAISKRRGIPYQLQPSGDHLFYLFPPGTPVLSAPFVFIAQYFGLKPVDADEQYDEAGERKIQRLLSALLTGLLSVSFYRTARLLLNETKSSLLTLIAVFGTQVWSTASRSMQSHIWGLVLVSFIVYVILRSELNGVPANPIVLGTLVLWAYLVRPTFATTAAAVAVYLLLKNRKGFALFCITGVFWFGLFIWYSLHNFDRALPPYFFSDRFGMRTFFEALAGHLISPSRGFLVFVPAVFLVIYNAIRYRKELKAKTAFRMALAVILMHWIVISLFVNWWAGYSYGSRLVTDILPWIFLIALLGVEASIPSRPYQIAAVLLVVISILIQSQGACCQEVWRWNAHPIDVDQDHSRVWSWSEPQFLACLM